MADLAVTAANVVDVERVKKAVGVAGEAITAGAAIYQKIDSDGQKRMYLALNTGTGEANLKGLALTNSAQFQPVVYATDGTINPGGNMEPGAAYFVSGTAGKICPSTDLSTDGQQISLVGIAVNADELLVILKPTGKVISS